MSEKSFRMRMDDELEQKFTTLAGENKSKFIRDTIEIMSSADFQKSITLNNMEKMEKLSIECMRYLNDVDGLLNAETISEKFPAFISSVTTNIPYIFVKRPTYKVRILKSFSQDAKLKDFDTYLDLDVSSPFAYTQCYWLSGPEKGSTVFLPETMCLGSTLADNLRIKENVEKTFKSLGYNTEIVVAYSIVGRPIKITKIEGIDYFALLKKFDI